MIPSRRVGDLQIERHPTQKRGLTFPLEVGRDVERQAINAGDEGTVQQITDSAVAVGLACSLG